MATQDNDNVITFGSTSLPRLTHQLNGDSTVLRVVALSRKPLRILTAIVDGDGNTISDATIANGTTVSVPVGDSDFSLTGGDFAESGREDVLEAALAEGWYFALLDTNDAELTGSNGLTRQQITVANFS